MLKHLGFKIEVTKEGAKTIELYKQAQKSGEPFDVVIMDLTVPGGMGGKEAIEKLIELDPKVKAIVSSGYSNDPVMAKYSEYGFCGIIMKPYDIKELSKILHTTIEKR